MEFSYSPPQPPPFVASHFYGSPLPTESFVHCDMILGYGSQAQKLKRDFFPKSTELLQRALPPEIAEWGYSCPKPSVTMASISPLGVLFGGLSISPKSRHCLYLEKR